MLPRSHLGPVCLQDRRHTLYPLDKGEDEGHRDCHRFAVGVTLQHELYHATEALEVAAAAAGGGGVEAEDK